MPYPVSIRQKMVTMFPHSLVARRSADRGDATRESVLAEMEKLLEQQFARRPCPYGGVAEGGLLAAAGIFRDDPTLADICAEIYRERDAEPKE